MAEKMRDLVSFLLRFWQEETRHMNKLAVMSLWAVIVAIGLAVTLDVVKAEDCYWTCVARGNCYYWQEWCDGNLNFECQSCCYCGSCDDGPGCCSWVCVLKGNCYFWQEWCNGNLYCEYQSCCYCLTCEGSPSCP